MKQITSIITVLKTVAKYGAYFIVIFDIISYATEKLEAVNTEKEINGK